MARGRRAARYLDKAGRDLANRTRGLAHEARHLVRGETPPENGHRPTFDIMHDNLAPGTRLLLGSLGCGLFGLGLAEDAPQACVLGTIGGALALAAAAGHGAASVFGFADEPSGPRQQQDRAPQADGGTRQRRGEPVPVM